MLSASHRGTLYNMADYYFINAGSGDTDWNNVNNWWNDINNSSPAGFAPDGSVGGDVLHFSTNIDTNIPSTISSDIDIFGSCTFTTTTDLTLNGVGNNAGTIYVGIANTSGTLLLNSTFNNNGVGAIYSQYQLISQSTLTNNSSLFCVGSMTVNNSFYNNGTLYFTGACVFSAGFSNTGTMECAGDCYSYCGSSSSGSITQYSSTTFSNNNMLNNSGSFVNDGVIQNGSTFNNSGSITNNGYFVNSYVFTNSASNNGTFINSVGASGSTIGSFVTANIFINSGSFSVYSGTFTNNSSMTIGGPFTNWASFISNGDLNISSSTVDNYGSFTISLGANLKVSTSSGSIANHLGGSFSFGNKYLTVFAGPVFPQVASSAAFGGAILF